MSQVIETGPAGHYGVKHVLKSEIMKIATLPSTAVTLGVTVVASLLVTGLVTNAAVYHGGFGFDPTQEALTGLVMAALTAGVFGALLITGEYSSGTIRATLAATPKRPVLLAAKVGVTTAVMLVFTELLSFASFFLGQAILSGRGIPSASLGSAGAFRAVLMTGLFISLLALMAFGFGLTFRSTAAAIAAFAGVVFVLPLVVHAISERAVKYLPPNILVNSITATVKQGQGGPFQPLSPALGLLLMAVYAAIALAIGAVVFVKRDA
jgi:ABC-2 type transport system permease protein